MPLAKTKELNIHYNALFNKTSFSHFAALIKIDDAYKRAYYELLVCKTRLSVRKLKDAIHSLAYKRTACRKIKSYP